MHVPSGSDERRSILHRCTNPPESKALGTLWMRCRSCSICLLGEEVNGDDGAFLYRRGRGALRARRRAR